MKNLVLAIALAAMLPSTGAAEAPFTTVATKEAETPAPKLPDVELFDQDGKKVRLPDLVRGQTVAINFVFTTCTTICSPLTAIFARTQAELGARLGKEVRLISLTLDPAVDTPERLNAYASQFGRQPGWTFVTGKPADVNRALRAFGAHAANKESHTPMVLIGNEPHGKWSRLFGLSSPARIVEEIDAVLAREPDPVKWLDAMPYTRAVFEEALRLYPPAPSINREPIADDEYKGLKIPRKAQVLVMPWTVHRHRKLWDRPDAFMPERFHPENRDEIDRYQYLPFGAGPRVCIGMSFAMQEAIIALAILLSRYRFDTIAETKPWPVQKLTTQPQGGLPMRVTRR